MSTAHTGKKSSTFASILRVYPYARPAMPRIYLGMVAALLAALVALAIPQVLRAIVDGPLTDGDSSAIWPPVGIVLALGVLEAVHDRAAALARAHPGHPRRGAHAQRASTRSCRTCR